MFLLDQTLLLDGLIESPVTLRRFMLPESLAVSVKSRYFPESFIVKREVYEKFFNTFS